MAAKRPGQTKKVTGPQGQIVYIRFYEDGCVHFRLMKVGPMMIKYAFLPGRGQNVIVELVPGGTGTK